MRLNTLKNFVLAKEVTSKGNFHPANISMTIKDLEEDEDYIKIGSMILLNTKSNYPNYIKKIFPLCTELENCIPLKSIQDFANDLKVFKEEYDIITIEKEKFLTNISGTLKKVLSNMFYVLDSPELKEAIEEEYVLGYIELNKNKFLVWY